MLFFKAWLLVGYYVSHKRAFLTNFWRKWGCHCRMHRILPAVQWPDCTTDALRVTNELSTYPEVSVLLCIFATLPVTTATGERSFSALKYVKNYLHSTMNDDRLNGVAHMYINCDTALDYSTVMESSVAAIIDSHSCNFLLSDHKPAFIPFCVFLTLVATTATW